METTLTPATTTVTGIGFVTAFVEEQGIRPVQEEPMQMNDETVWFQITDPAGNLIEIVGGI